MTLVTPADTVTVCAAQGGTYGAVIADMERPKTLSANLHCLACYVMISRARSLDGLLILRPATRVELDHRPPQYLLDEIDRLLRLEHISHAQFDNMINFKIRRMDIFGLCYINYV